MLVIDFADVHSYLEGHESPLSPTAASQHAWVWYLDIMKLLQFIVTDRKTNYFIQFLINIRPVETIWSNLFWNPWDAGASVITCQFSSAFLQIQSVILGYIIKPDIEHVQMRGERL